jgi:hypothetical protein
MAFPGDDRGQPQLPVINENEISGDIKAFKWLSIFP